MKHIIKIAFLAFSLIVISCQKTIIIDNLPYEENVSVECLLQPGEVPVLYLNKTVPFFNGKQKPEELFIGDAIVKISGGGKEEVLEPFFKYNQLNCLNEPYYQGKIPIEANTKYELHIEAKGKIITSSAYTNVAAIRIDSLTYIESFVDLFGEHEGVVVVFNDILGEKNHYRFVMDRQLNIHSQPASSSLDTVITCIPDGQIYLQKEIGRFIYSDGVLDGLPITIVIEPAFTHMEDEEGAVYIQSLDENAAKYFDKLDKQQESNINPFIEPVFLQSNINNGIGIFGTVNQSQKVTFVFPE